MHDALRTRLLANLSITTCVGPVFRWHKAQTQVINNTNKLMIQINNASAENPSLYINKF